MGATQRRMVADVGDQAVMLAGWFGWRPDPVWRSPNTVMERASPDGYELLFVCFGGGPVLACHASCRQRENLGQLPRFWIRAREASAFGIFLLRRQDGSLSEYGQDGEVVECRRRSVAP